MAAAGGESIVVGIAAGAGAITVQLLGVEPGTIFAAVAACFLGAPFAKPAGHWARAAGVFLASVVVTCHAAAGIAVASGLWMPALVAHERRVQAAAAIAVGVLLHVIVSYVPALVASVLRRVGVVQT